ncbi:hypothetical protein [Brevundimonas sp.]|uniref:hypothetical protein n=1 Tax=Brevundimonas sp. TaxID=1871086 RepID=UPI003AF97639
MSMAWMRALAMVMTLAVAACSMPSLSGDENRNQEAQALMAALAAGDDARIAESMAAGTDPEQVAAQLPFMKSMLPAGPVPEGKTGGWQSNAGTAGTTYTLVRSYDYPDRVIVQNVVFRKEGDAWKVQGFHVNANFKPGATPEGPAAEATGAAPDAGDEPVQLGNPDTEA